MLGALASAAAGALLLQPLPALPLLLTTRLQAAAPPAVETPHASKPAKVTAGSAGKTAGSGSKKPAKRLAEGGSQGGGAKRKRLRPHSDAAAPGSRPAAAAPPQQGEQPKHGAAGSRGSKLTPMHRLLQRDLLAKFGGGPLPVRGRRAVGQGTSARQRVHCSGSSQLPTQRFRASTCQAHLPPASNAIPPVQRELAVYFDPQKPLPVVPLVLQLQVGGVEG